MRKLVMWGGGGLLILALAMLPICLILREKSHPAESGRDASAGKGTDRSPLDAERKTVADDRGRAVRGDGTVTVVLDDLNITIYSLDSLWTGRFLRVGLAVYTSNPNRNYQFQAWSDSLTLSPAKDNLGNVYPKEVGDKGDTDRLTIGENPEWSVAHGLNGKARHLWGSGGVTAQVVRHDVIYYQLPVPAAKRITIELPAKNVGGSGTFRLSVEIERAGKE